MLITTENNLDFEYNKNMTFMVDYCFLCLVQVKMIHCGY